MRQNKVTAESKGRIYELVYGSTLTTKEGFDNSTSLSSQLFNYKWTYKGERLFHNEYLGGEFLIGETVYVKPINPRCTSRWQLRVVTRRLSPVSIEVCLTMK